MQITTIGLDLAKSVFQVHAVDAEGHMVFRKSVAAGAGSAVLPQACLLPRGYGLRHIASLGAPGTKPFRKPSVMWNDSDGLGADEGNFARYRQSEQQLLC
jgi:hypothetical protein